MKVITLENIVKFVETKHGKQTVDKFNIKGDTSKAPGVIIIHNNGSKCTEAFMNKSGEVEFKTNGKDTELHCILFETDICDFHKEHPFMKSREALSGYLIIDNRIPSEEELHNYWYELEQ